MTTCLLQRGEAAHLPLHVKNLSPESGNFEICMKSTWLLDLTGMDSESMDLGGRGPEESNNN